MLVGRRAGLPLTMLNMPMHVISCLKPDPPLGKGAWTGAEARAGARAGAGGAGARGLDEPEDGEEEEEEGWRRSAVSAAVAAGQEEEVLFIDAYHNNIMNQEELR